MLTTPLAILGFGRIGTVLGCLTARRYGEAIFIDPRMVPGTVRSGNTSVSFDGREPESFDYEVAGPESVAAKLIVCAIRAGDVAPALDSLDKALIKVETPSVLVASNGIDVLPAVATRPFSPGRMATYFGAAASPSGIHAFGKLKAEIAGLTDNSAAAAALGQIGLDVSVGSSVRDLEWKKLPLNLVVNLVATLVGSTNRCVIEMEGAKRTAVAILDEFRRVATASGFTVPFDLEGSVFDSIRSHGDNVNSTLADLIARKSTELPYIAGNFLRAAQQAGISVPATAALAAVLEAREGIVCNSAPATSKISDSK